MPVTKLPHWEHHYLRYNKRHPATLGLLWPPSATQNIQIGIDTAVRGDSPCYGWGSPKCNVHHNDPKLIRLDLVKSSKAQTQHHCLGDTHLAPTITSYLRHESRNGRHYIATNGIHDGKSRPPNFPRDGHGGQ